MEPITLTLLKSKRITWTNLRKLLKHCEIHPTSIHLSRLTRCLLWKTGRRYVGQVDIKPIQLGRTSKARQCLSFRMDMGTCGCVSPSKNCSVCSQALHVASFLCATLEISSWTKADRKLLLKTWNSLGKSETLPQLKLTLSDTCSGTRQSTTVDLWS